MIISIFQMGKLRYKELRDLPTVTVFISGAEGLKSRSLELYATGLILLRSLTGCMHESPRNPQDGPR